MKPPSIGIRLTLWYLGFFLLSEVVFGVAMYSLLQRNLFAIADSQLDGQAADLQRFLESHQDWSLAQLPVGITADYKVENSRDFVILAEPSGNLIYRSPLLTQHPLPAISFEELDRPRYFNRKLGSTRFRFLSRQMEVNGRAYLVRIGLPMQEESDTLADFRAYSLWFGLLVLLVASTGGYWMSRRVLT